MQNRISILFSSDKSGKEGEVQMAKAFMFRSQQPEGRVTVSKPAPSLRWHISWILLLKLVLIIGLKLAFFPALEQQHQPAQLFQSSAAELTPPRSSRD